MLSDHELRPIEILLVEDNPGDVRLTFEAFKDGKISNNIVSVPDGVEALAHLRPEDSYRQAARPDLILLDLNLPRMDGHELLAELKADPTLARIPVIVLTTSHEEHDVLRAHALDAAGYMTKPVDFAQLMDLVATMDGFHLSIVTLVAV
jgi:CheY-like chemotaxis protein